MDRVPNTSLILRNAALTIIVKNVFFKEFGRVSGLFLNKSNDYHFLLFHFLFSRAFTIQERFVLLIIEFIERFFFFEIRIINVFAFSECVEALIRIKGQKQPPEEFYQKKMFLKVPQISQENHLIWACL